MQVPTEDPTHTMAFAEIALGQIRALGQAATPRNFEVWYHYASGYNPALNQMINDTLARAGTLSDADINEIYEACLAPTRLSDRIDEVNSQVMDEMDQVAAIINDALGSSSDYGETLAAASQNLGGADTPDSLRSIVETLVQNTREMRETNEALETRLHASKDAR